MLLEQLDHLFSKLLRHLLCEKVVESDGIRLVAHCFDLFIPGIVVTGLLRNDDPYAMLFCLIAMFRR